MADPRLALLAAACAAACAGGGNVGTSTAGTVASQDAGSDTTDASDTTDGGDVEDGTSTSGSDGGDTTDEGAQETSCEEVAWYPDVDGDGRGNPLVAVQACDPPPGHVAFGDDCNDDDPMVSPAASEVCDGIDNDCDALVDEVSPANATCNGCTLFEHAGHVYALCPEAQIWATARERCAAFGGDLVRFDDEAEQAAVVAVPAPAPTAPGGWSFALSDQATEGSFLWPDGSGPSYTTWTAGEPNDAGGNEDCAEISLGTSTWNDVPCTDPRAYVCEAGA